MLSASLYLTITHKKPCRTNKRMEQIDLKEKERIDKILDEWNADVKEMQDAL